MTSLSKQLQQLQTRPDGDQHLAKSFLFSNSDAKQISREQVHDLATSGLRTLLAVDNRFAPFLEPLFGQSTIRRERAMLTSQQNNELSEQIRHVCALLSPHLFVMAAQQVFEYLVRVYEVHTYDVRTVLGMFMPYHDHAIFGRVVMLLDLRASGGLEFLKQNQESGTVLPRASLVIAASENAKVMRLLCDIASDAIRFDVPNNAAFALLAGVATAAAARPENESVLRVLLPFLVTFLEEPHPAATPTALLIVCVWAQEGSLTPKALAAMVRPIIASLTWSQYPITLSERLSALGLIFKSQGTATHDVAFSPILELMIALPSWQDWWASKAVPAAATSALTHRLLDYCLVDLKNKSSSSSGVATANKTSTSSAASLTVSSNTLQFLCVACGHMSLLTKRDISAIFACFVTFLAARSASNKKNEEDDEVSDLLSSCLKALERRFPLLMDETISEALAAAMTRRGPTAASSNNVAAPTYDALIHFISVHFSGTKYEMIDIPINGPSSSSADAEDDDNADATAVVATRKAPLLTCLLHQVPEIRRLAFAALRHRVATEEKQRKSAAADEAAPTLVGEVTGATAAAGSALLPLVRHSVETETSPAVAAEAIAFAKELIAATIASGTSSDPTAAAVAGLLGSLWSMLSSAVAEVLSFEKASATAAFVAILGDIVEAEVARTAAPATKTVAKKAKLGGKTPAGITAAGAAEEAAAAAVESSTSGVTSAANSALLSLAVYFMTVVACAETGSAGTTAALATLFAKLKRGAPAATGFVIAPSVAPAPFELSGASANGAVATKKADSDSDSDDEDRKKPKKKIGEAPSSSAAAAAPSSKKGGASSFAPAVPAPIASSFCPEAIFGLSAPIVAAIAAHLSASDLATLVSGWAKKRSLMSISETEYATLVLDTEKKTYNAVQKNMLTAHIAEAAVLAAIAAHGAVSSSTAADAAYYKQLSAIVSVTAVPSTAAAAAGVSNAVSAVAVANGLTAGLTSGLEALSSSDASTNGIVIAKVLALLVVHYAQILPPLATVPAAALWALSSLSSASDEEGAGAPSVVAVPRAMALAAHASGIVGPSAAAPAAGNKYLAKDQIRVSGYHAQLFIAVAEAVFGPNASSSASTPQFSRDAIAFALLLPTMAPSDELRQYAVERLQSAVLAGLGGGKSSSSNQSFISVAVRQLTASSALSVTSVNSLVEVLASAEAVKGSACLTEDMAKAILDLLLPSASGSASAVPLSPAYVSSALRSLFAHNKRSLQRHGELVLSRMLPAFVRPTLAKAGTGPISPAEADLLFTAASFVSFAGVTAVGSSSCPTLEATCETAALCLHRGGVRVVVEGAAAAATADGSKKVAIRSVFVPILAALTAVSPKLLVSVAAKADEPSFTFAAAVLTPETLLLELLVPLFDRSGAVSSDADDATTAAQHVVAFLTTTTFGFDSVLTPVLPTLIASLGDATSAASSAAAASSDRKAGAKKGRADEDEEGSTKKKAKKSADTAAVFAQLVDLATEVIGFLGCGASAANSAADDENKDITAAASLMANDAAAAVMRMIAASSGIVASRSAVLDSATVARLFFAAFTALQRLPISAADVAAAGLPAASVVATKVSLLKFIGTLVQAAPSADGFVRENTDATALDRRLVAVDTDDSADGADDDNAAASSSPSGKKAKKTIAVAAKETALAYILRTFEMNALTPFLLGQGAESEAEAAAASGAPAPRLHTVTLGTNSKITAASGSVALTLSSMRAIQTLITTVHGNSVALTAALSNSSEAAREALIIEAKHRLVRQSLMLLSSLFVAEGSTTTASGNNHYAANALVSVVSQLLHVIGPLLSGAHASSSSAAAAPQKKASSSSTLGAATSLLHVPLMALYLRLDAAAAARQAALAEAAGNAASSTDLLADGGADYFVSATLLETPVDICVKILTSFAIEEQMAALCGLMELVCDPTAHLARISAAAASDNNTSSAGASHSNVVAELCARLIKAGRIANRQEPILTLIGLTIKHDNFLAPFIQLQHADTRRRLAAEKEEKENKKKAEADRKAGVATDAATAATNSTGIDASTSCANLLVAALNLFSHYHGLNAKTLAAAKERRRAAAGPDADDLSDVDDDAAAVMGADGEEKDDEFSEEKAYTTLLELLAGNSLACILSAINEPTFVDCQKRMLASESAALRQKGLETLLDRLHQSLPATAEEDALATGAAPNADDKAARDPRNRTHVLDAVKLKARPQTSRLSGDLIPLLTSILKETLTTDALFALGSGSSSVVAEQQQQRMASAQVAMACVEELVRIIGNGGSKAADKGLSKPQMLGGAGGAQQQQMTETYITQLFKTRARVNDLHSVAALALKNLFEWGTALAFARRGAGARSYGPNQQVLITALLSPLRSASQHRATLQSVFVLSGACLNLVATLARTLSVAFTAPHANDMLKAMSTWMTVVMNVSTAAVASASHSTTALPMSLLEPAAGAASAAVTPSISNMLVGTQLAAAPHKLAGPIQALFAALRASSPEAVGFLRKALLHSVHFSLPATWMMAHPFIPTFVSFATHNCNVLDHDTSETSANFLASLRAVLGDRGLLECVCSALINNSGASSNNNANAAASHTEIFVPIAPLTHSMRLIFIFVERILNEMTKEEVATMPVLITGSGADESGASTSVSASAAGKNFWLAALGALAGTGVAVPSVEAMAPVFDAYTAFFIKFKEKTCAQFWTKITDWAVSTRSSASANASEASSKRRRTEDGDDAAAAADGNANAANGEDDGYSRRQIAVHFVYLSLYNHLLYKLRSIMTFSFPIVSNVLVELLQRYNATPFVSFSTAVSGNEKKMAALFGGSSSAADSTGGQWILRNKALAGHIFAAASALMTSVQLMAAAQIPEDPSLAARTGVQHDVFFAKVDVFNTFMPLIIAQLANTHVFSYDSSIGAESSSLGFFKRAERSVVPAVRRYFACLDSPKLWSLTQKELIKYLRHPRAAVRRAALLAMQLCYRDGGDVLCSHVMAEGLPAIVEMTEDSDKEVVEQARLLCGELSTITGTDVLHAMA